jgi:hypothetical protein
LSSNISAHEKFVTTLRIHSELEFLRELSKQSSSNQRTLRIFEAIVRCTALVVPSADNSIVAPKMHNAFMPQTKPHSTDQAPTNPVLNHSGDIMVSMGLEMGDINLPSDFCLPFDFQFGPVSPNLGDLMSDQWITNGMGFQSGF